MAWQYSEKTTKLFMDAVQGKPGTHLGELEDPDGFGEHGSISCGDALRFTFRTKQHPTDPTLDVITEAKYLTFGCTSAIAASEALCALIEQGAFTPIQALKVTNADIVDYLEGLPAQKIHCSVMGAEALEAAVFDWARKRSVDLAALGIEPPSREEQEGKVVCTCFGLTQPYIKRKIEELGLKTIPEITNAIKAGGGCMTCHHIPGGLQDTLDEVWGKQAADAAGATRLPSLEEAFAMSSTLSPYQLAKKIENVIEEYIRPMLQQDGGDLEVVDIKDRLVYVHLKGACAGCAGSKVTLKRMVESTLKDRVDEGIKVIDV